MKAAWWGMVALAVAAAAAPAQAKEPKPIASAKQVKPGMGAVRLSVQSQTQQAGTLHVWFLREGGDPGRSADLLKIERKTGVPLIGQNMIDSRPRIYAVPAGRYRLLAHGVKCPMVPPVGAYACSITEMGSHSIAPAFRYGDPAPVFEVEEGKLTDAGEFILEAPAGTPIDEDSALKYAQRSGPSFMVRVRPIAAAVPKEFQSLEAGPAPVVPETFRSNISCAKRPPGAMMYIPFDC